MLGKTYLGIQIYRFYIKCTKCLAEITFLTDPESQDYEMENGAIRNFECIRLAEKQAEAEAKQEKEDEANNPMKVLENRTRDSRREMDILETLEDLKEMNTKNATIDPLLIVRRQEEYEKQLLKLQEEEDEREIERLFPKTKKIKTEDDNESETNEENEIVIKSEFKIEIKKEEPNEQPKVQTNKKLIQNLNENKKALNKSTLASFVKKKDNNNESNIEKSKSVITNAASTVGGLGSLCSYSSDDDDSQNE